MIQKLLGSLRAIKFLSEIRRKYDDSVVELKRTAEKMTIEQIKKEIEQLKRRQNIEITGKFVHKSRPEHLIFSAF